MNRIGTMEKMNDVSRTDEDYSHEESTIRSAQQGDENAILLLYEKYKRFLYAFVYSKVGNREEAEDLTQEIWIKILGSLSTFNFQSKLRTWICQIGKFTIADYWRRVYRMKISPLEEWDINAESLKIGNPREEDDEGAFKIFQSRMNMLENILRYLPDQYRQVLEFRFIKNYSLKQTAKALEKKENNIKVLQFRALQKAMEIAEKLYGKELY